MEILATQVRSMGRQRLYVCDRNCTKAWGVNGRRRDTTSSIDFDGEDDIVYLADGEVGHAPADPGTYEGGHAKPMRPDAHNKWCMRECERCDRIEAGEPILVPDYSVRHYNQPWKVVYQFELRTIQTTFLRSPVSVGRGSTRQAAFAA